MQLIKRIVDLNARSPDELEINKAINKDLAGLDQPLQEAIS